MKVLKMLTMVIALIALFSPVVNAAREGNGGDLCEKRIKEIRDDLDGWIKKGGSAHLRFPQEVSLDEYNQKMQELLLDPIVNITCVQGPVYLDPANKRYPKTCKNYIDVRGVSQIECDFDLFMNKMSESDQYLLIHHEYAGLAGFETTIDRSSSYVLSNQLTGFLENRVVKRLAIVPVRPDLKDAVALNFVKIPLVNYCGSNILEGIGCFNMGSRLEEKWHPREERSHTVVLKQSFEMQVTPVTQALWFKEMGSNPSKFCSKEVCRKTHQSVFGVDGKLNYLCPLHPVENVGFNDVQAFIKKMNAKNDGYKYALPTEAQWEYSARAGTSTAYFFGDDDGDDSELVEYAWYAKNSGDHTHEIMKKPANAFGLYDMSGNVWQWVSDRYDWYAPYSKSSSAEEDHTGQRSSLS